MKNEKDQNVETEEDPIHVSEREDDDEEEKKIDTFFKLIKSYQEARKRRREELAENSGDVKKKTNVGETSGAVVPAFQPEDFSRCRTDVKPLMAVSDHKEGDVKVKEEEEQADKEGEEEKGLDL
ncbi:hypothetical protein BRARA_J00107 [Brassica rapa]|uniref:Protein NIM1-INTERACTING 1 n=1 Tax=Brassica campestris TaxID=3711 RepID=A0A397XHQ0_BRACM|nr:hypothetical protein BRARA_J00107 [Brassica rapa]